MADVPPSPSTKVKFQDSDSDRHNLVKHVPTQRYDRKEIQKRLDMETWIEEQLLDLFGSEDYPQLDVDDVHKIEPDQREEKLKVYLSEAKKSTDNFIKELITRAADIKPVDNS